MEFQQNVWGLDRSWQTRDIARFCKQGLTGTCPQGFAPAGGHTAQDFAKQPPEKACHFRFSKPAPRGSEQRLTQLHRLCPSVQYLRSESSLWNDPNKSSGRTKGNTITLQFHLQVGEIGKTTGDSFDSSPTDGWGKCGFKIMEYLAKLEINVNRCHVS